MYALIKNFPQQLKEAVDACQPSECLVVTYKHLPLQHVVVAGMGSSLLPGILVQQWLRDHWPIPLSVNPDYTLPAYVNQHTLVIVVSYSGNTQETINAFKEAIERKAAMVVITSGNLLQTLAQEQEIPYLLLPAGLPPRAALGYSLAQLLFTLSTVQPLPWDFAAALRHAATELHDRQVAIQTIATAVAKQLTDCIPVIYTLACYEGAALRLRQQLNENSKQLCWHHTLPELTHNEIMGWKHTNQRIAVVFFTGPDLPKPLMQQQEAFEKILRSCTPNFTTLVAKGPSLLTQTLYLVHLSDWISWYLAEQKNIDPMEIDFIEQIKRSF